MTFNLILINVAPSESKQLKFGQGIMGFIGLRDFHPHPTEMFNFNSILPKGVL